MRSSSFSMLRVWGSLPAGPLVSRVSPRLITRSLSEGRREVTTKVSLSEVKEYGDLLQSMRESEVKGPINILGEKEYWRVVRLNYFLFSSKICFGSEVKSSSRYFGQRTELLHEVPGARDEEESCQRFPPESWRLD